MKTLLLICLLFLNFLCLGQTYTSYNYHTVTQFHRVSGYIEIRDAESFERQDAIFQQKYLENMEFYNKAIDYYYTKADYESALFYFKKAFPKSFFSSMC